MNAKIQKNKLSAIAVFILVVTWLSLLLLEGLVGSKYLIGSWIVAIASAFFVIVFARFRGEYGWFWDLAALLWFVLAIKSCAT
jgi:F0F1-type ATP synthase assembly protein I